MAAPTVVYDTPKALRFDPSQFGFISGKITISSYDTAHPSAGIEKKFRALGTTRVIIGGVSTTGFFCRWDPVTGAIYAYTATSGAVEASASDNVGDVNFMATGVAY